MIPSIGRIHLAKLTAQQVQAMYSTKLREGLSQTTVRHLHMALHSALESALRLGLVQRNVCDMVNAPRMRRVELLTLSPDQARSLLEAARGDRFEALYTLALTTGMREGELLSLRRRSVDLDRHTLQVRTTIRRTTEGFTVTEAKTARSRRKLLLTPNAVDALRRHREAQTRGVATWATRGRITTWPSQTRLASQSRPGTSCADTTVHCSSGSTSRRSGSTTCATVPPHCCHTAATLLLLQGVHPKVVSEMLGHASVSITLDLYSHVLPDMRRDAMEAMEAMEAMARLFEGVTDNTVEAVSQPGQLPTASPHAFEDESEASGE
jgi:integrase